MAVWKCNSCGNTVDLFSPPDICPSCNKKCEFVDVSCYIPDCGGAGSGNINPTIYQESYEKGKK